MKFGANLISNADQVKLSSNLAAWVDPPLITSDLVFRSTVSFSGFRTRIISEKSSSLLWSFSYVIFFYMYSYQMNLLLSLLLRFPLCSSPEAPGRALIETLCAMFAWRWKFEELLRLMAFILVGAAGCDFLLVFVYSSRVCLQNEFPTRRPD